MKNRFATIYCVILTAGAVNAQTVKVPNSGPVSSGNKASGNNYSVVTKGSPGATAAQYANPNRNDYQVTQHNTHVVQSGSARPANNQTYSGYSAPDYSYPTQVRTSTDRLNDAVEIGYLAADILGCIMSERSQIARSPYYYNYKSKIEFMSIQKAMQHSSASYPYFVVISNDTDVPIKLYTQYETVKKSLHKDFKAFKWQQSKTKPDIILPPKSSLAVHVSQWGAMAYVANGQDAEDPTCIFHSKGFVYTGATNRVVIFR